MPCGRTILSHFLQFAEIVTWQKTIVTPEVEQGYGALFGQVDRGGKNLTRCADSRDLFSLEPTGGQEVDRENPEGAKTRIRSYNFSVTFAKEDTLHERTPTRGRFCQKPSQRSGKEKHLFPQ